MANRLINMAVNTSTFGAELITAENAAAARSLLDVGSGGGGQVASVNGQVGAVVLDYEDVGAASAAQGAKADTALQPGDAVGAISSVNGKTGTVVLNAEDVGAATTAQGAKADTALQPGDIPAQAVTSVNGKTGAINLVPADLGAATSAQGAKADTAVQPGALATVATTGSYNSLTSLPTLGTAASQSAASFATAAQGAKADTAVQPPTAWINFSYNSGWSDFSSSFSSGQYRVHAGRVWLKGLLKKSSTPQPGDVLFVLPAGYRPPLKVILGTISAQDVTTTLCRIDVASDGTVTFEAGNAVSYLTLEGLSFSL